ncbi:hypothetical protein E2562_023340 [Oryza meyeriana var. granulata]|uniref:Homeobox domain-containing protein n=1 Tax=Oryza meyeriana var. granulata TaxID=110450 RepID=A0A6G1E0N6_9ORYZ|nr:hypothetical protein E2562_023340 [Oryza meyeriana var. granulata]
MDKATTSDLVLDNDNVGSNASSAQEPLTTNDDSADNDYDPALAQGHKVDEEESSGEDGGEGLDSDDSSSEDSESSEDEKSKTSKNGRTVDDLGLPSEDSEDGDFDPAGPSLSQIRTVDRTNGSAFDSEPDAENLNLAFMERELDQDTVLPVSSKRHLERLDYKKLYDEAYGKASSDSSDDEEWSGNSTPQKGNLEDSETDSLAESPQRGKRLSRRAPVRHQNNEHTPQNVRPGGSVSDQQTEVLCSNSNGSAARKRHFGPAINQKLKVYFKEDPYPSRATKENLAQELGLTFNQSSEKTIPGLENADEARRKAVQRELRKMKTGRLSGSSSTALATWNSSTSFCSWEGVTCSRRRPTRVVALSLSSGNLAGALSPAIGNLTFLQKLNLSSNELYGEIPPSLGRLRRLQILDVDHNSFSGAFPANLTSCIKLTRLYLQYNQHGGRIPEELGNKLTRLETLALANNTFIGTIPASLANLSSLQALAMNCNWLVGLIPPAIGNIVGLQSLLFRRTSGITV